MHPSVLPTKAHRRPGWRRAGWLGGIFAAWGVSITVLVAGLARAGCASEEPTATASLPAGWTLRVELDARHPDAEPVTALLIQHGPGPGDREAVALHGGNGSVRRRLQSAGWSVVDFAAPSTDRPPQLRVIAPDGTIAWTGRFNSADLATPGGRMLSHLVLTEVAQGRLPLPVVPIACVVPGTAN